MPRKPNPLKGIKPSKLRFTDDHEERLVGAAPEWVKEAIGYLRDKFSELGINLGDVVAELGDQAIEKLIALIEKSPASFKRMFILAALNYLHKYVHVDELMKVMKGE